MIKMSDDITNRQIYDKLAKIENMIKHLASEEDVLIKKEEKFDKEQEKELQLLARLHGKNQKKVFDDIYKWKENIWENCPDRETNESKEILEYICRKTGKNCTFTGCYRNIE